MITFVICAIAAVMLLGLGVKFTVTGTKGGAECILAGLLWGLVLYLKFPEEIDMLAGFFA